MELLKYLITYLAIGIVLSLDAFTICIAFGTKQDRIRNYFLTPLSIGIFHIIFPIIAFLIFGVLKLNYYGIGRYISSTIFFFLGIINLTKKEHHSLQSVLNFVGIILLAIGVSIDSFFIGISLSMSGRNIFIPSCLFGIISFISSFFALILGHFIGKKSNINFDLFAGIFFIILGIITYFGLI